MGKSIDFIYLSESDMIKSGVLNMKNCIKEMEETFKLLNMGDYRMGGLSANEHGIKMTFPNESDIKDMPLNAPDKRFMAMPAYLGGKYHMCGIKTYGSNPNNISKGLPRSILMMSLLDADTGTPLSYMSANLLSAMRTGAVTGLGAKYLCNKNCQTLAIVGPGVMGRYALDAFMEVKPNINTLKIKGRGKANIESFIKYSELKYPQIINYIITDTYQEACQDSDIVYFGTTNAAKFEDNPFIEEEWIKPGAVIISASALLVNTDFISKDKCKLVADNYKMYEGWGKGKEYPTQKSVSTLLGMAYYDAVCQGKISKDKIVDIGEIICEEKSSRDFEEQIIMYAVGGMPIEDVAWAYECYNNALNNNIGTTLKLWDEPELTK